MQYMMIWHHLNTNPSQTFCKTLTNLKNSKNFQKPQILGQKIWNVWLKDEKESYQNLKLSKSSLIKKNVKHIDPKHTHTHTH